MTEFPEDATPAGEPEDHISAYFEVGFAAIEKAMQEAAAHTDSGRPGATVGTVREPVADAEPTHEIEYVEVDDAAESPIPFRVILREFVPPMFRSTAALKGQMRRIGEHGLSLSAWHFRNSHRYLGRAVKVTGIGAKTAVVRSAHFWFAAEYGNLVDAAIRHEIGDDHVATLRAEHAAEIAKRRRSFKGVLNALSWGAYVLTMGWMAVRNGLVDHSWGFHADALLYGAGEGTALWSPVAFAIGRRELRRRNVVMPIIDSAPEETGPIGDTRIVGALRTAGLLKDGIEALPVGHAEYFSDGSASHTYDLTGGLTLEEVKSKAGKIAGILRLPADQLEIIRGEHESQIIVHTTKVNPFATPRTSPLFGKNGKIEKTDIWNRGVPVGFDRRGNTVYMWLRHVMALLGGMSQTGKGMLLRNIIPALALDPRVNIRLVSAAKAAELMVFAPICATFFGGRGSILRLKETLRAFLNEAIRRDDHMTENGVTRFTEESLKGFPLEILIIDEAQLATIDNEIRELLEEISGFAASLNMGILLVTQDPDTNAIPAKFNKNTKARLSTRTANDKQTNAILGARATGMGLVAHQLSVDIPGMTIADCAGATGVLLRSFFMEDRKFDAVVPLIEAAIEFRRAAGRLPGRFEDPIEAHLISVFGTTSAAGGPKGMGRPGSVEAAEAPFLGTLRQVFDKAGVEEMRSADIALLLNVLDPAGDWGQRADENPRAWATRVGGRLREAIERATGRKIDTVPVVGPDGKKGNGYRRADLDTTSAA